MVCASEPAPESTDPAPPNGEGDRFGDRRGDDPETFPEDPNTDGTCSNEGRTCPRDARGSEESEPCEENAGGPSSSDPCEENACLFGRVGLAAGPGGRDRQAPPGACPPGEWDPPGGPSVERALRRSDAAAPPSSSEEAASEAAREDASELA